MTMQGFRRLHSTGSSTAAVPAAAARPEGGATEQALYSNYVSKLRRRYKGSPDIYSHSADLYSALENGLAEYEREKR